jgi:hypothetical protein
LVQELFGLSERALDARWAPDSLSGQDATNIVNWHQARHIDELHRASVIDRDLCDNLRRFLDLSSNVLRGIDQSPDTLSRTGVLGTDVVAAVRVKRIAYGAQISLNGQMMFPRDVPKRTKRFFFVSHVCAGAADFGYDYDLYREAVAVFNSRHKKRGSGIRVPTISLSEFDEALRWREKELERVHDELSQKYSGVRSSVNNGWQWPPQWGHLGWGTAIMPDGVSSHTVEQRLQRSGGLLVI